MKGSPIKTVVNNELLMTKTPFREFKCQGPCLEVNNVELLGSLLNELYQLYQHGA